jgi:hypothetical protein
MRRLLLVRLALLVCAPAASAQDATPTPVPSEEADDGVLEPDEIPPEETVTPVGPCTGEGADADYQYCGCDVAGPDGDYQYCAAGSGGAPPPTPAPASKPAVAQTRPLSTGTLPYTGGDPTLVALFGLGLLLTGLGLRRAGPSRSG